MGTNPWSGLSDVRADPNHPAVYISWNDVQEMISRINTGTEQTLYRRRLPAPGRQHATGIVMQCRDRRGLVFQLLDISA